MHPQMTDPCDAITEQHRCCLELCAEAGERLKSMGFEVACCSMKSEAVYYRFPGRFGVLRVGMHKYKGGRAGMDEVVATITFRGGKQDRTRLICSEQRFQEMIWTVVGQYMDRSAKARPTRWEITHGRAPEDCRYFSPPPDGER
jgi:hypothetical protein